MRVGVPKEIKNHEYRVGLTPGSVAELVAAGHEVVVETQAGMGIDFSDAAYVQAGATILPDAAAVFAGADMIVKVKEPQPQEIAMLEPRHLLFTYLHLAADKPQAEGLMASGATCIAYETVTSRSGALPLLKPMSEVAGRMSIQVGAHYLEKEQGGRGVLLGGVPGVAPAKVAILGGGVAGINAAQIATGQRADVTIYDINNDRLAELDLHFGSTIKTAFASKSAIAQAVAEAGNARDVEDDEARQRAGRHRDRPGRLFRDEPCDDPRRPGLHDRRGDPLLRREHARRGGPDECVRAQQCDAPVRAQAGEPGRGQGDGTGPPPRQRPQRVGRQDPPPGRRRSARFEVRSGVSA
jgi:NAD/NADP transhydrogenase alpha subunit